MTAYLPLSADARERGYCSGLFSLPPSPCENTQGEGLGMRDYLFSS
jgi:hypothetical protein